MLWLDEQMNEPSRSDHYLMQIALEIKSIFGKRLKLSEMKIPFETRKRPTKVPETDKASMIEAIKARWIGWVTPPKKKG